MGVRGRFNKKRKLQSPRPNEAERRTLLAQVDYTGSPYHKRNPGDFGLTPPALPRPDKTLCDGVEIFEKAIAQELLQKGILKGLVSEQKHNGFPQNIWSVTDEGVPVEAQLENQELGTYHGYPLLAHDPFFDMVLSWWEEDA